MTRKSSGASERVLYDWSPEALTKARALWDAGYSASEIGRAIDTSKNSLVGKAHRLGWPARPSPIRASTGRKPHVRRILDKPTLAPLRSVAGIMTASAPEPIGLDARRTCAWIEGEPSRHARYCEAPVQRDSSYCPAHHARCWVRPIKFSPVPEIGPVPMRDGRADDRGPAYLPG